MMSGKVSLKKPIKYQVKIKYTIRCIKMLTKVRNWVTIRATLPGVADIGIMKLIIETTTIAIVGK